MSDTGEFRILRKLVKEMLLKEGSLLSQNEFNRKIGQLAQKLGENAGDVRGTIAPILREIFNEMVAESEKKTERKASLPGEAFHQE